MEMVKITKKEYETLKTLASSRLSNDSSKEQLARLFLSTQTDYQKCISMMNRMELDPTLLRSVIYINLKFYKTSYFNINLSLGYQSSIENIIWDAASTIAQSRYLNSQDITFVYDPTTIVVIKSFIPLPDDAKIYHALDKICQDLDHTLDEMNAFEHCIAYGNLYSSVDYLKKSFDEAKETINIGQKTGTMARLYILEDILFDNVHHHLNRQIINKLLNPTLEKLKKKDGTVRTDLLFCAEIFVDNCMNISATSKKCFLHRNTINMRLEKLKELTGLDPAGSFRDAFIIKMLSVHLRQYEESGEC